MRRHDGGTDRGEALEMRRQAPVAGTGQFPVFGRCGARCAVSQTAHRAAPGLRPGVQRPPARSWLTSGPTALFRKGWASRPRRKARPGAVVRTPRWSAMKARFLFGCADWRSAIPSL